MLFSCDHNVLDADIHKVPRDGIVLLLTLSKLGIEGNRDAQR